MKTVHIIGSKTLGGAERFYLRLVEALQARGRSTVALTRQGGAVTAQVPSDVPVFEAPMRTVWDPWSRWRISRLLHQIAPGVVQTYMGRATRLTHVSGSGIMHVARLGGYYKLDGYRHADAWVGNTRGVCDHLIQGGMSARRVFHIPNFMDPPAPIAPERSAALRAELGIPADAWVYVTAGRFVPVKGHRYLLEAFARLPLRLQDRPLHLLMVGDGPLRQALTAQARESGIGNRITWTGWRTDPAPFYALADSVAFPSLEEEALGNVILEAWAHGKPLVTALFRGAREITRHGQDAWQVPCGDARALADGLRAVTCDAALAQGLARAGRLRLEREFGRGRIVSLYLELYVTLLAQSQQLRKTA